MSFLPPLTLDVAARDVSCCNPSRGDQLIYQDGVFNVNESICCSCSCFGLSRAEKQMNQRTWEAFENLLAQTYGDKITQTSLILAGCADRRKSGRPLQAETFASVRDTAEEARAKWQDIVKTVKDVCFFSAFQVTGDTTADVSCETSVSLSDPIQGSSFDREFKEAVPDVQVIKSDGTREVFNRNKIAGKIASTRFNTIVSEQDVERVVELLMRDSKDLGLREISTRMLDRRIARYLSAMGYEMQKPEVFNDIARTLPRGAMFQGEVDARGYASVFKYLRTQPKH